MADSRRTPRITDVAALAGVSVGTVSKALNGTGQLREQTRERVREAAATLGFAPNELARGLLSGRTFTVGVITSDSFGRFSIPVMLGAEEALGQGRMSALLCDGRGDPVREQHYVRTLLGRRVDGIIVTGRRAEPRAPVAPDLPVPVVYAHAPSSEPGDCSVVVDEPQGAALAVRHLVDTGRRRIAHVTGPAHHRTAAVRAESAAATLAGAGLSMVGEPRFGEWSEAWGRQAAHALLLASGGRRRGLDAVFCGSDQIARGVADGLREAGVRVPDDVALVGFDNWDVMATACRPPLTTVDPQLDLLGREAGRLLLRAIDGEPTTGVTPLPCRLVVRQSTEPS